MDQNTWETLAKFAGVIVPLVIGLIGITQAPERPRRQLKADSEILKILPEDSAAYRELLAYIGEQVSAIRERSARSRDWTGFSVAIIVGPLLGLLCVSLLLTDGWAWNVLGVLAGLLTLIFLFGLFDSVRLAHRDERGIRRRAGRHRTVSQLMSSLTPVTPPLIDPIPADPGAATAPLDEEPRAPALAPKAPKRPSAAAPASPPAAATH